MNTTSFTNCHSAGKSICNIKSLLLSACLCSYLISNFANSADTELPEIIVTAKGLQTPENSLVTSHILNSEEIDLVQAKDLTTLLNNVSGISITDSGGRGSTTGVFLRGTNSSQTIVLIDGVRVGSATLGAAALNSYPVEAIDRVEVVKGPLSGIYGADAVGGVIQIFTRKGDDQRANFGQASVGIGSNSLQEYGVSLSAGNANHSFYLSAHDEKTDGIDRTSIITGSNDDKDGYQQSAISLGVHSQLSDRTSANVSILQSDNSVEFDNTFGEDTGFYTDTKTFSGAVNLNHEISAKLKWVTTVGINEDESITPAFSSEFKTARNSLGTELIYVLSDETLVSLGVDYYDEEISPNDAYPVSERDNQGAYFLLQQQFGAYSFVGNLRYDDNSAYGSEFNGSVAVGYEFSDKLRAVISYGTAFVAPSFNFLYFPFFGNPELLPEESKSVEMSLYGKQRNLDWRISAYQTQIENLFSFDPTTFLAANIGEAQIKGIEMEASTHIENWTIGLNLDLLDAENVDTGVELDDRAQRKLGLFVSREWARLTLRASAETQSDRYDNNGTKLSSYALMGVSGIYRLNDRLAVHAAIDNLFDKDYTVNLIGANDRYHTEGRQARFNLKFDF